MRPRTWTDEQLRDAVASSVRLIDVLRRLGLSVGGRTLDAVRNRILQLGLDCSHMERPPRSPKWQATRRRTLREGNPIPLQLDHIYGDRRDNRRQNLRLLCPNCHAQTDTWWGKNRGRYG